MDESVFQNSEPSAKRPGDPVCAVSFLENKRPEFRRAAELCRKSEEANRWANGGPVSQILENLIGKITDLHSDRRVVVCSSGTAGINMLAGVHALKSGHPMRWAVSAYSFFSTFIGPYSNSLIVDCDRRGMLDIDALSTLSPDSYDGVCVTNLFGLYPDISEFKRFCDDVRKPLLVDNAHGLFGFDRSCADSPDEIISFHHTKPWGFGEGGCVIVSKDDEAAARSLINFGASLGKEAWLYSFNGKMSDVAAAFIVERLERIPDWAGLYGDQYRRITGLVEEAGLGLKPLAAPHASGLGTGQIPFLADRPVPMDRLKNDYFVMRKYYRPPDVPGIPAARKLYDRIVNVPCHLDMAGVADADIVEMLSGLVEA